MSPARIRRGKGSLGAPAKRLRMHRLDKGYFRGKQYHINFGGAKLPLQCFHCWRDPQIAKNAWTRCNMQQPCTRCLDKNWECSYMSRDVPFCNMLATACPDQSKEPCVPCMERGIYCDRNVHVCHECIARGRGLECTYAIQPNGKFPFLPAHANLTPWVVEQRRREEAAKFPLFPCKLTGNTWEFPKPDPKRFLPMLKKWTEEHPEDTTGKTYEEYIGVYQKEMH